MRRANIGFPFLLTYSYKGEIMDIVIKPLDEPLEETLSHISTVIRMILGSKKAQELDAGEYEMMSQAERRINQVANELGERK
jgi:hypothetical protein